MSSSPITDEGPKAIVDGLGLPMVPIVPKGADVTLADWRRLWTGGRPEEGDVVGALLGPGGPVKPWGRRPFVEGLEDGVVEDDGPGRLALGPNTGVTCCACWGWSNGAGGGKSIGLGAAKLRTLPFIIGGCWICDDGGPCPKGGIGPKGCPGGKRPLGDIAMGETCGLKPMGIMGICGGIGMLIGGGPPIG